jgi:hypothetical protein
MRMHGGGHQRAQRLRPGAALENIVDNAEQLVVVAIEKQP